VTSTDLCCCYCHRLLLFLPSACVCVRAGRLVSSRHFLFPFFVALPLPCFSFSSPSPTHSLTRTVQANSCSNHSSRHYASAPYKSRHPHLLTDSLPLISNPSPSAHLTQTLLVLQRKLPVADKFIFAAMPTATRTTTDVSESGELPRVALESLRTIGSGDGANDSAWVAGCDGVGWDVLLRC